MRRLTSSLFLLIAALGCTALAQRPAASPSPMPFPSPPKPGLAVVLQRQAIRENDELEAQVWVSNEWDKPISDVTLRVNTPSFLSWAPSTCADWKQKSYQPDGQNRASVGTIGPSDFHVTTICLKSAADIMVGDFNVSFTCEYAWPMGAAKGRSFVTTEKALKSNLLGSDSVAGVPIALAAFIVPGLFFWLVIDWMKVPWNVGPGLGDKVVYSVIVSVGLLWLISWWRTESSGAIGLSKLFWFAAAGGVAGVVAGWIDRGVRAVLRHKQEEQEAIADAAEAKLGDDSDVLLQKLVAKYPDARKPRAVVKFGDSVYTGSLMEETDEVVAVVGWYHILKDNIQTANRNEILTALDQATTPSQILNIASTYKLKIEPRNAIREHTNGVDTEEQIGLTLKRRGVVAEQHFNTDEDDVIVVE
jgi:hypothetical protein